MTANTNYRLELGEGMVNRSCQYADSSWASENGRSKTSVCPSVFVAIVRNESDHIARCVHSVG
jgi:hypothetical protein